MTSQSRKKRQTTVPTPTCRTSDLSSSIARRVRYAAILTGVLSGCGLGFAAPVSAQEAAWGPTPFVPANNAATNNNNSNAVPANSLRANRIASPSEPARTTVALNSTERAADNAASSSNEAASKLAVRWQKPKLTSTDVASSQGYDRAFGSSAAQNALQQTAVVPNTIRQPGAKSVLVANDQSQRNLELRPASGFSMQAPEAQTNRGPMHIDPAVQSASYNQNQRASNPAPATGWHARGDSQVNTEQDVAPKRAMVVPSQRRADGRINAHPTQYQIPSALKHSSDQFNPSAQPPTESTEEDLPLSLRVPMQDDSSVNRSSQTQDRSKDEEELRNPFPNRSRNPGQMQDSPSDDFQPPTFGQDGDFDLPPTPPRRDRSIPDCDVIRTYATESDISKVRIDSSPSFVEGYRSKSKSAPTNKENFVQSSPIRTWYTDEGDILAEARLVDLHNGYVELEKADGSHATHLLRRLSEADQAYVSDKWGIPFTCALGNLPFRSRDFTDSTVTWKASGACHKPLYFEEVQLERYGHEWGPVAQPVISTARFFGNVAILPYKMGIHPMNECQYSLGYYRPGSCAPWTIGPVPISLRGALMQAKTVTGIAVALP